MLWLSCILSNIVMASLLGLTAWIVQRWLKWQAVARIIWILVLVKLVTPSFVPLPLRVIPSSVACAVGACGCGPHGPTQAMVRDWLPWTILAVWLSGTLATIWVAWRRCTQLRSLMAHAKPLPAEWESRALRLSSELSIRCPPLLLAVPGRVPPLVVPGLRRACVLLPLDLIDQIDVPQRDALLLHELIHIKRGDHWVRVLELAVGMAYWWLPVVGSVARQMRSCEEASCDAAVVGHLPRARRDYARLLLDVIDFANPVPRQAIPPATAMSAADDLEQRLVAILDESTEPRRRWIAGLIAAGLGCAILPCQFQCKSIGRRGLGPTPIGCEPPAREMGLRGCERNGQVSIEFCCPS